MTKIYNKASEKEKRRLLRKNMSKAEVIMWSRLKQKQILGYKFRRQYSVGSYVIDFYCPELKLAIEIDGTSHFKERAEYYDRNRQESIEQLGIRFLRFSNMEVYKNRSGVLEVIVDTVRTIREPSFKSPLCQAWDQGEVIKQGSNPSLILPLVRGGKRKRHYSENGKES